MYIQGWAFKENELELRDKNLARFKELSEVSEGVSIVKNPAYGRCNFSGKLMTDEAKALSESDIALIADGGNLCFGGTCVKNSDGTFRGSYSTD